MPNYEKYKAPDNQDSSANNIDMHEVIGMIGLQTQNQLPPTSKRPNILPFRPVRVLTIGSVPLTPEEPSHNNFILRGKPHTLIPSCAT